MKKLILEYKPPVGHTKFTEVGETLGQGTNEGAVISTINLDGGITEEFKNSESEVSYVNLKLGPVLFQDDVARWLKI